MKTSLGLAVLIWKLLLLCSASQVDRTFLLFSYYLCFHYIHFHYHLHIIELRHGSEAFLKKKLNLDEVNLG